MAMAKANALAIYKYVNTFFISHLFCFCFFILLLNLLIDDYSSLLLILNFTAINKIIRNSVELMKLAHSVKFLTMKINIRIKENSFSLTNEFYLTISILI